MKTFFVLAGFAVVLFSCNNERKNEANENCSKPTKITNPNGMSEMSVIMEDWYNQLEVYAANLKAGKMVEKFVEIEQEKIFTAEVSKEKDNVHGEQFDAFTKSFFYNYDNIGKAGSYEEQVSEFNLAVRSCVNCHEQHCQGPIVRIKKLTVPDKR